MKYAARLITASVMTFLSAATVSEAAADKGLLSSNFMLNMIRVWGPELLNQMPKRRKRSVQGDDADTENNTTGFGLLDSLMELQPNLLSKHGAFAPIISILRETPEIFLPMLVKYAQTFDAHPDCVKRTICEANQEIVHRFGLAGHVLGTLGSEFIISSLTGASGKIYDDATEGGKAGREGYDCYLEFPECPDNSKKLYD